VASQLIIRPGHPDFLELPWEMSIVDWDVENLLDLPKDISRHAVRFLNYEHGVYAVKELPMAAARNEYRTLRQLETRRAPAVRSAGLVETRRQGREVICTLAPETFARFPERVATLRAIDRQRDDHAGLVDEERGRGAHDAPT